LTSSRRATTVATPKHTVFSVLSFRGSSANILIAGICTKVSSLKKVSYQQKTGQVVYRSKMSHGKNKKNFEVFKALDFIAAITQHIPEQSFQLVRYYGWYSNRMRGDRKKLEQEKEKDAEKSGKWLDFVAENGL
jgi:hypothetical protein